MSLDIDNRIVEMQFDNSKFERGVKTTLKSLESLKKGLQLDEATESLAKLQKAGDSFSLAKIADGIDNLTYRFSWFGRTVSNEIDKITYRVESMVKSLSIDQVTSGWQKYAEKTSYVQTIMNATGKSIDEVNGYLNKLMWFSDETSYSFTDMTAALGQLTSSGGKIENLIPMLEGMANATAYAGKSAAEFSRTMYNLNQSYSAGYMQYIDWKSVEMAGVGSEALKQAFIDAGIAVGTLNKEAKTTKGTLVKIANFGTTLNERWATTEVMEKAFGTFSEMTEKAYELVNEGKFDTASDAYAYLSKQYDGIGITAARAAQEAKSFNEAIDATKDAVSSGWMRTFELIFGNYDEARVMWTDFANELWDLFASGADSRNELLETWHDLGGRTDLLEGIYALFEALNSVIYAVKDAWASVFPETTADDIMAISTAIKNLGTNIRDLFSYEENENVLTQFTKAVERDSNPLGTFFANIEKGAKGEEVKKLQQTLYNLGYDLGNAGVDGIFGPETQKALVAFQKDSKISPNGIFDEKTFTKLGEAVNNVFNSNGPTMVMVDETTESVVVFSSALDKLRHIAQGVASGLHIAWEGIKFLGQAAVSVISIFKPIGDVVLSVFGVASDALIQLDQSITAKGFAGALETLNTLLEPLADTIQAFANAIKIFFNLGEIDFSIDEKTQKFLDIFQSIGDWVKSLGIMEKLSNAASILGKGFKEALPYIGAFFAQIGKFIGNKTIDGLRAAGSWLGEKIPIALSAIGDAFVSLYQAAAPFVGEFASKIANGFVIIWNAVKDFFATKFVSGIVAVGSAIGSFFVNLYTSIRDNEHIRKILTDARDVIVGFGNTISSFFSTIFDWFGRLFSGEIITKNPIESFMDFMGTIGDWFNTNFENIWGYISDGIDQVTEFGEKHKGGFVGIILAALGVFAFSKAIGIVKGAYDIFKNIIELKKLTQEAEISKHQDPNKTSKFIISIAIAIATTAAAIVVLGNMKAGKLIKGLLGITACIAAIIGITVVLAVLQKKIEGLDYKKVAATLVGMGIAIGLIAASIFLLGNMSGTKLGQGIYALTYMLGLLVIVALLLKKIGGSVSGSVDLKGVTELGKGVAMLAYVAYKLSKIKTEEFWKGFVRMSSIVGVILIFMGLLGKIGKGSTTIKLTGLIALAGAISMLGVIAVLLGKINVGTFWKGLARMVSLAGVLLVITGTLSFISKGAVDIKIGGLIGLAAAIGVLAVIATLLGKVDAGELWQGIGAVAALAAVLGGLMIGLGKVTESIKIGPMILFAASLATVMISFAVAIKLMQGVDTKFLLAFAGSLSIALLALITACGISSKLGVGSMASGAGGLAAAIAIIVASITLIAASLGEIDKITNGGLVGVIERGGDVLAALGTAVGKLIGGVTAGWMEVNSEALSGLADSIDQFSVAFDKLKVSVDGINGDKDLETDTQKAIDVAEIIKGFFDELGLETNGISTANVDNFNSRVTTIVDSLGSFGTGIGLIRSYIIGIGNEKTLKSDISTAIGAARSLKEEFFDKIGEEAIGMDSKGLSDYNTAVANTLEHTKTFATVMGDFRDNISGMAISDITADTETALSAAKSIASFFSTLNTDEYEIEKNNGFITGLFAKDTKGNTLIDNISEMGVSISSLSDSISLITENNLSANVETMLEAYKAIAEFSTYVASDDVEIDFGGKMSSFENDMRMMGNGIAAFSESIQNIDPSVVSNVAGSMGQMLIGIMDISIPETANAANSYVALFIDVGANIARGLANGLEGNAGLAVAASRRVAQDMLNAAKLTLAIHSPSGEFEKLGFYSDKGLSKGLSRYSYIVTDSVRTLGDDALDAAKDSLSLLTYSMNDHFADDPVIRPVVDMSNVDRSADRISRLTDGTFSIGTTVQATSGASRAMMQRSMNQNGSGSAKTEMSQNESGVNVTGNNFYIRSDNDIKMLANELATLSRQQQRSLGADY